MSAPFVPDTRGWIVLSAKDDEALILAIKCGDSDTVKALLDAGAKVHVRGDSALTVLYENRGDCSARDKIKDVLLAAGADPRTVPDPNTHWDVNTNKYVPDTQNEKGGLALGVAGFLSPQFKQTAQGVESNGNNTKAAVNNPPAPKNPAPVP